MLKRKQDKTVVINKSIQEPSEDLTEAKRRLDKIRTREVSLVDEGANGREFLIVKNKNGSDGMGKKEDKDKTLLKNDNADPQGKPEGQEPESKPAEEVNQTPAEGEPKPTEESTPAPEVSVPEMEIKKGKFSEEAENALQEIPVVKALAMPQKEMFLAMSEALMHFGMGMDMIRADLTTFAASDGKTGFMGEEVVKSIKKQLESASEEDVIAEIEKAGKKMKKTRLEKLKTIMTSLETLINELDESGDTEVSKGGTMTDQTKKNEVTEKNKAASEQKTDLEIAKEAAKKANDKVAELEKANQPEVPAEENKDSFNKDEVQKMVDAAVEKATKPLKEEIETLKEAPADPASEEGDETEEVNKNKDGEENKDASIFKGVIY